MNKYIIVGGFSYKSNGKYLFNNHLPIPDSIYIPNYLHISPRFTFRICYHS